MPPSPFKDGALTLAEVLSFGWTDERCQACNEH